MTRINPQREHLRQMCLEHLEEVRPTWLSDSALEAFLRFAVFPNLNNKALRRELDYLALRGLLTIRAEGRHWLLRLTAAGVDAVEGARSEGVSQAARISLPADELVALRALLDLALSVESQVVTAQAFSKARSKLKPEVFERLNQTLQQQIDSLGLRQTWRGLRVLAVDGSTVHLPLEPAMGRFFGLHGEQPTARLSALHDVMDGQTLHSLIVPPSVGERDCAHLHLAHLPADSLTLFDRGYPGHWLFALFEQQRRHFLMRLPCGYNAQVKQFLRSGQAEDTLPFAANHPEARLFCTEAGVDPAGQVALRLVRVELASGESEVLVTSLLDRQAFPVEVFADLYHRRWGIETDYRRLKQTLSLENFSGRSVTAVKQDFHAGQLLKNLALLMQHLLQPVIEQRHKDRKLRWQVNFTQGVSRLKNTLVELLVRPCVQGLAHLLALMANSLSAVRPGRSFPRQRKRLASRGCEGFKPTR